jgi:type VI secretion system protein ImpE
MPSPIDALFRAGALDAAVAAANDAVRKTPSDVSARILLAELLVFTGNLERADVLLDAASVLDPSAALMISEFRQLMRAEMARRQFWREGRVPEILGVPAAAEQALLAAIVAWRAGDGKTAERQADIAETCRPKVPVRIGEQTYPDFRDADDLCGGNLEVLTTTGKFYRLPVSSVETIFFHPPHRPRDLARRRADVSVADGPDGTVYLPALYAGIDPPTSDALRLGRETAWTDTAPVRGSGQRVFLAGDEGLGIMDLTELHFRLRHER